VIEMQGKSFMLNMGVQGLPSKVPQEMYRVIGNAPFFFSPPSRTSRRSTILSVFMPECEWMDCR